MMGSVAPSTHTSIIAGIASNPSDPDAWARFVFIYGPQVIRWGRRLGLQDADARDVAQDVLLTLLRQMSRFTYDPSKRFRGWLRMVVYHAWCDWARRAPEGLQAGDDRLDRLRDAVAGDELVAMIEREHERELFEQALASVGRRVEPRTLEAFRLLALQGMAGQEAADRLGMKLGSTFAAKAKVQRMIREEVERLDRAYP